MVGPTAPPEGSPPGDAAPEGPAPGGAAEPASDARPRPRGRGLLVVGVLLGTLVLLGGALTAVVGLVAPGLLGDARNKVYEAVPALDPHYDTSIDPDDWRATELDEDEVERVEARLTEAHVELNELLWGSEGDADVPEQALADAAAVAEDGELHDAIEDARLAYVEGEDAYARARLTHELLHDIQGPAGMR